MARTERSARVTTDHDEIKKWVEEHGGHPAAVKRTEKQGDPGLLRIDFPEYRGAGSLEPISWDDFFDKFEEKHLAFIYQDKRDSRFHKLVNREDTRGAPASKSPRARAGTRSSSRRSSSKSSTGSSPRSKSRAAGSERKRHPGKRASRSRSRAGSRK